MQGSHASVQRKSSEQKQRARGICTMSERHVVWRCKLNKSRFVNSLNYHGDRKLGNSAVRGSRGVTCSSGKIGAFHKNTLELSRLRRKTTSRW